MAATRFDGGGGGGGWRVAGLASGLEPETYCVDGNLACGGTRDLLDLEVEDAGGGTATRGYGAGPRSVPAEDRRGRQVCSTTSPRWPPVLADLVEREERDAVEGRYGGGEGREGARMVAMARERSTGAATCRASSHRGDGAGHGPPSRVVREESRERKE
jgi:hypothetical protein